MKRPPRIKHITIEQAVERLYKFLNTPHANSDRLVKGNCRT